MHGGRAWVEERVGGGASFRVALPGERPDPTAGNGSALDGLAASTAEVH
jgi:hypothetical protein